MPPRPRPSEDRTRLLIQNLNVGVLLQGPGAEILLCNPKALELLGLTEDQLVGRSSFDPSWNVVQEDGSPFEGANHPVPTAIRTRAAVRDVVMGVFRPTTADRVWLLVHAEPELDAQGSVVQVICTFHDITDRKQREESQREGRNLDAIGQLASGIAHDFNNLLTVMMSHSELALESLPRDSDARRDIQLTLQTAHRAAALTRQLLTFARRQMIQPRVLNLNDVIAPFDELLRRSLGVQIHLVQRFADDLWDAKIDPAQVEQVVMNLAINARDAMPDGGALIVSTENVLVTGSDPDRPPDLAPGPYVQLSVADTGLGMTPEVQRRAFEPFFTTKGPGRGTGLGLSTVHGIAKQNHGHVRCTSTPGQGTTISVLLRRSLEPRGTAGAGAEPSRGGQRGTETVLVVDDDAVVRTVTARVLRSRGYRVIEAQNAPDAMVAIETVSCVQLMVSDVIMPGVTGPELAARCWKVRPDLPVLFMSGYSDASGLGALLDQAGVGFLAKPFSADALAAGVRQLLGAGTRVAAD